MEEYRSSRSAAADMYKQRDNIAGILRPNYSSLRSTPRLASSRENSPSINKSSPDNSAMSNNDQSGQKEKSHRRINLFRRKNKTVTKNVNNNQQQTLCSSSDESDSSASETSSSNNINKNNNNNNVNNCQSRSGLLSTLSRKCSKKFRNLTDRARNENNSQKSETFQNGCHAAGRELRDGSPSRVCSGGSNEAINNVKRHQHKTDGHYGKFDLFSSCRKVPGSPREALDSISRKVRKDALKARVEAQREQQYPNSSSDDEEPFIERAAYLRRYHSDESLQKRWPGEKHCKSNRTERYYRRKVKDDDSSSKCEDYPPYKKDYLSNPTQVRRNWTITGSASPCSSPQPKLLDYHPQHRSTSNVVNGQLIQNSYNKYEEINKTQSSKYYNSGSGTSQRNVKEEHYLENIVVSGYLPLRKAGVIDGHLPRAPTPPLRLSFNQNSRPNQRPQSFNLGDISDSNVGRNSRGNGSTVTSPTVGGPMTLVMSSMEPPTRNDSGRPLSFTSTSHVVYNHHYANLNSDKCDLPSNVENGSRNRASRLSPSIDTPTVAYMSDSQISGHSRPSRTNHYEAAWRKQSQQLNKNFNSIPKPWNTAVNNDDNNPTRNVLVDCVSNNCRPPPSPVRNDPFNFGSVANGPMSPKYSSQALSKPASSFRHHQQQLQSSRKYQNNVNDGNANVYTDSGRLSGVTSPPLPPTRKYFRQQQSRSSNLESVSHRIGKLVSGSNNTNKNKSSDNHLEDALLELEKIYHSMKEHDDDDISTTSKGRRNSTCEDLLLHSNKDSDFNVDVATDGQGSYNTLDGRPRSALSNRNGSVPNKLTDDLAYRKIARQAETNTNRPAYMATGSYLLRSPALSPSVSIDDVRASKVATSGHIPINEPDTVLDDLSYRSIRDANLQKVIDPQPPFGIPLGPISNAAASDYMHAQAQDLSRPKMRRRFRPDLVKDDLAYRALRKSTEKVESNSILPPNCLNFDELDSILRCEFQQVTDTHRKKYRAARSLSANLTQIIAQNKLLGSTSSSSSSSTSSKANNSPVEKSLSISDLRVSIENEKAIIPRNEENKVLIINTRANVKSKDEPSNATSSSTDTLTDFASTQPPLIPLRQCISSQNGPSAFRPLSAQDGSNSTNDIWQVRVTVGKSNDNLVKLNDKPAEKSSDHPLVKPIPLKLDTVSAMNASHRFGNVLNDDSAKTKGSPIDEMKLDELLSSLALDTVHPAPVVTCNGHQSLISPDKVLNKTTKVNNSETFPALVTVDGSGEMSVKILFPNLRSAESSDDIAGQDQERVVNRASRVPSGLSHKVAADGRNRKEMSSVSARPRNFITSQCVDEKFVGSRVGGPSPLTLKKDVKDVSTSSERTITLKRSGAFNSKSTGNNKTAETLPTNKSNTMPDNDSQADRIAKYKEERRKQLANQYGPWNTKEDNTSLGNEASYMRFSLRSKKGTTEPVVNGSDAAKSISHVKNGGHEDDSVKKLSRVDSFRKDAPVALTDDASKTSAAESVLIDNERISPVDSMVRLNRASRLRAQARANESTTTDFGIRSGSFRNRSSNVSGSSKDASPVKSQIRSGTPISSSSDAPMHSTQANSHPMGNESESGGTTSDATTGKMKDKSAKRKSHLNRMGSVESRIVPSDSDDTSRRFRRHRSSFADKSSNCSTDGLHSDSVKSTRSLQSAVTVTAATALPISFSKSGSKSNSTWEKKSPVKSGYLEDGTSESDVDGKFNSRKQKRPILKRPEIPEIFRSKVSTLLPDKILDCKENKLSSFSHLPNYSETRSDKASLPAAGIAKDQHRLKVVVNEDASKRITEFSSFLQITVDDKNAQKTVNIVANKEKELSQGTNLLTKAKTENNNFNDMGARIFRDGGNSDQQNLKTTNGQSTDTNRSNVSLQNDEDHENGILDRDHYDPSGNWHLAKSSLSEVYSYESNQDVSQSFSSSKFSSEESDNKLKTRMVVAYGVQDVSNGDQVSPLGELPVWSTRSPPMLRKKLPLLNHNVTVPTNTDSLSSRSISSDELWSSLEADFTVKFRENESSDINQQSLLTLDGTFASVSPRRRRNDETELPTRSILKSKEDVRTADGRPPIPHSILKRGSFDEAPRSRSPDKCSILKKKGSSEESDHRSDSPEIVSILRRKSSDEVEDGSSGERHSILRRKSMLDETEHSRSQECHSILKKQCSVDAVDFTLAEPKPILKKKSSSEDVEHMEPKPILKKRSSTEDEFDEKPKPILKTRRRSGQEDLLEDDSVEQVEMRRTTRIKTSSPILRFRHLEDEESSVPNRRSSTNSRPATSSEEEFVSVPSSPGSWMQRKSTEEDNLTLQRWERNAAYSMLNENDALSSSSGVGNAQVQLCTGSNGLLKFDESTIGDESAEKKLSSSSSDSSTEEEEDDSEETTSEEDEELTENPPASIETVKKDSDNDTSVQSASSESRYEKPPLPMMPVTTQSPKKAVCTESVHVKSESSKMKTVVAVNDNSVVVESGQSTGNIKASSTHLKSDIAEISAKSSTKMVTESVIAKASTVNETEAKAKNDEDQDDVPRLSVAERASLFMQKLQDHKKPIAAPVTRYVNRRGLQRSQTQPVTVGEVNEASKIAEESVKRQRHSGEYEDVEVGTTATVVDGKRGNSSVSELEDEPSKLSLADRVKLFNQKMIEERLPTRKLSTTEDDIVGSPPKEKPRRAISRFKTQPVTSEELEKAQLISNAKQADVNIMKKGSDDSLSRSSASTASDDNKPKGILKKKDDVHMSQVKTAVCVESKSSSLVDTKRDASIKVVETKASGISIGSKTATAELKSILKMDTFIKQSSLFKKKQEEQSSSSSSDNDDEDESEGVTINLRNGSPNVISRGSTDEDSSHSHSSVSSGNGSGSISVKSIKNEAVMRRRKATIRKQEERKNSETLLSQTISSSKSFECNKQPLRTDFSGEIVKRSRNLLPQRSSTQPISQMEKDGPVIEVKGGSIAERLAALKASQEEDWKRRLERNKSSEVDGATAVASSGNGEESKMIHETVILLEGSQQEWKRRVEEKDATKFTVAGKMGMSSPPQESPVLDRKRRVPKPTRFQSRTHGNLPELVKTQTSGLPPKGSSSLTRSKSLCDAKDTLTEERSLTRVSIPKPDDEGFSSFFESVNLDKLKSQKFEIQEEAFNQIVSESHQLLVQKRSVQITRRHAGAKNPLRALAARDNLQTEYTEMVTGVAEKELRLRVVEQLAKNSGLATSALAGLASTEDFTSVNLRKSSSVVNALLLPYKDVMLIQVKGRRQVQCRLVEPVVASLNKGDNFILVTPTEVYNWIGEFSNVIERAKGAEFSTIIHTKKDLGFKGSGELIIFDEEKRTGGNKKRRDFFERLGGQDDIADPGNPEDDEIFEAAITETNKIYSVEGDELVPYEKYWGSPLRVEMLKTSEVLVIDFGSEMYVWQGKLAPTELRKKAVQLAQEMWDDGYDYTDCDINPISPSRSNLPKYGRKRPAWALFSKVNQHMETVLFRSKFLDWPDLERVIQVKRQESETKVEAYAELQPYDAQQMIDTKPEEPDLVLENCHLGRGVQYWDESERRLCNITTLGVKVWHVLEYNHSILPLESWGQFHSSDTYVARWQYRVAVTGRDLSGQLSKHCSQGRERCAYFFWQGKSSTINEKGASALMTVELDEERGPHIRVDQGQEPPCFLNLFEGKMICYNGKRGDDDSKVPWRLFIVRGELENEAHLVEVQCHFYSLRENGVFVLVDCKEGFAYMWVGANVQQHTKDVARFSVDNLVQRRPNEMGFNLGMPVTLKDEEQGSESKEFLQGIGNASKSQIRDVMPKIKPVTCTPRLFHMTSVSGSFVVSEISCSFRSSNHVGSFPFLQSDIYLVPQPAIFLLDHDNKIYVWQGWWAESNDENEISGSAHLRWNIERRLALETTINYCNAKGKHLNKCFTVWAGMEPSEFKHFFPEWEEFTEAIESNKTYGRENGEKKQVVDVLAQLKRTRYPLSELKERPLPEGVDPSIIETYLSDEEFEEVLKTTRESFYALPSWKQFNIKKSAGLF